MFRDVLDPGLTLVGDRVELVSQHEDGRQLFIGASATVRRMYDNVSLDDLGGNRWPLLDLSGTP